MPLTLTDRTVRGLDTGGKAQADFWDTRVTGFGVRVSAEGRKTWVLRYRVQGRQLRMSLGTYPSLGLADARVAARRALGRVAHGEDPAAEKRAEARAETFAQLTDLYMEKHAKVRKKSWRSDQRLIDVELLPALGPRKVYDIKRSDVRALADAIAERGAPIVANRTLALLRKMFNVVIDLELDGVDANPCLRIRPPGVERRRDRVLSQAEIREMWRALEPEDAVVRGLFKLRLLTAQRGGEVHRLRWQDLDLDSNWWTIPAEFSKNGLPHRVPLSPPVVAIITEHQRAVRSATWVFPSLVHDQPVANIYSALKRVKKRSTVSFEPHDLRRTAASMMASAGVSRVVIGKILNHAEPGVTAVYDRHSYDPEKRGALDAWGQQVEQILQRESS